MEVKKNIHVWLIIENKNIDYFIFVCLCTIIVYVSL